MSKTNPEAKSKLSGVAAVVETVHRLRAPGGCPWDREQTHQSLRPHLIEEAYEAVDVLDRLDSPVALKDDSKRQHFIEELGDVLMQVLIHSEIAAEAGHFTFDDVATALNAKLIRRHPHVFGSEKASDATEAYKNWEERKALEKPKDTGVLAGLPKGMPALERTERAIEKVSKVGFQWPDIEGPRAKVSEELSELDDAIGSKDPRAIRAEIGDLLFSLCNLAYHLKERPSDALRECLLRFEKRFSYLEKKMAAAGKSLKGATLEEMDVFWEEAKALEKGGGR